MIGRKLVPVLVVFLLWGANRAAVAGDVCAEPVMTAGGQVKGEPDNGTCAWRGIPYAAPPVDDLRWRAPEPAAPWTGVREAVKFGDRCMQGGGMLAGGGAEGVGMSEDCLTLNIWRPEGEGPFPVMIWIHGGGYYTGSGSDGTYWGDRLAETGQVVVVTINYRLDLFGFMAHPQLREEDPNRSTGSYGSLDQAAAIKWVHENIAGFGGDPQNVTIFGQSAGGASVCTMVATPLNKGMFQRAIMQSGLCELSANLEDAYDVTRETMKDLGCDPEDLACMRKLPAEAIIKKAAKEMLDGFLYMPTHDGYILTDTPLNLIKAGEANPVDFLSGTVLDEFGKAVKLNPRYYYTAPFQYESRLQKAFGMTPGQAAKLVLLYPLADYGNRPVEAYGRMFGADATMQCPTYRGLNALAGKGQTSWFYRFEYHGMKMGKYIGSYHSAELPFVFDSFDRGSSIAFYKGRDLAKERGLSREMQLYWSNFARTGDPNGPGLPEWKPYSEADQPIQILDLGRVGSEPAGVEGRCEFWGSYPEPFVPMANRLIRSLL